MKLFTQQPLRHRVYRYMLLKGYSKCTLTYVLLDQLSLISFMMDTCQKSTSTNDTAFKILHAKRLYNTLPKWLWKTALG